MKRLILPLFAISLLTFSSCKIMGDLGIKPSHLETVLALKNILDSSTFRALKTLKNVNDGGIEGVLPKEIGTVLKTLKTVGYGDEVDQVTKINRQCF